MVRRHPRPRPDSLSSTRSLPTRGPKAHRPLVSPAAFPILRKFPKSTLHSPGSAGVVLVASAALLLFSLAGPQASGQRVQFPSPLSTGSDGSTLGTATGSALPTAAAAGPGTTTPGTTAPGWTGAATAPGNSAPAYSAPGTGAAGNGGTSPYGTSTVPGAGSGNSSAVPSGGSTLQPPGSVYQPPGSSAGTAPGSSAGTAPGTPPGAAPGTFQTPGAAPTYSPPGSSTFAPPGTTYVPPAPGAALEGTIQAPSADWDPYGTPGTGQPALFPQDPSLQFGPGYGPSSTLTTMRRLLEEVRLDYEWLAAGGLRGVGVNSMEIYGTFALPFLYNTEHPLLITPGFAIHFWDGPVTLAPNPADPTPRDPADLPPQTFDAYLDLAWNPQITPWLGGELSFRTGIYSDFRRITEDSLRYMGKGMLVMTMTPSFTVKAGIWYLDRNRVKLLPAGGVIWTPNQDIRFEIFFPEPKIARRLAIYYNTEWWAYIRGEYGGGAWTLRRADLAIIPVATQVDSFDYNDLRFAGGVEFVRLNGLRGLFEVGAAFDREIRYRSGVPRVFYPPATVFLRASLAY